MENSRYVADYCDEKYCLSGTLVVHVTRELHRAVDHITLLRHSDPLLTTSETSSTQKQLSSYPTGDTCIADHVSFSRLLTTEYM